MLSSITFIRKDIIPLIKQLHPDLLSHCSVEIKQQNMSCIQNLNDLWDTLESGIEQYNGRQSTSITLQKPFRDKYDLTCYLSASPISNEDDDGNRSKIGNARSKKKINTMGQDHHHPSPPHHHDHNRFKMPLQHIVPSCLCKKQIINEKLFQTSIESILLQQHKLFNLAGLQSPWLFSDEPDDKDHNSTGGGVMYTLDQGGMKPSKDDNFSSEDIAWIERRMFDRWLVKQRNYSSRGNYSSLDHLFNSSSDGRGLSSTCAYTLQDIDLYIKRGMLPTLIMMMVVTVMIMKMILIMMIHMSGTAITYNK